MSAVLPPTEKTPKISEDKNGNISRQNLTAIIADAKQYLSKVKDTPPVTGKVPKILQTPSSFAARSEKLSAIGDRLAATGNHEEAIMLYMAADMGQVGSSNTQCVTQAGKSLLALGKPMQAEAAFSRALEQSEADGNAGLSPESRVELDGLRKTAREQIEKTGAPESQQSAEHSIENISSRAAVTASILSELLGEGQDFNALLADLANAQRLTSQLCVDTLQSKQKANRDIAHQKSEQAIKTMEQDLKTEKERKAAEGKMSFWSKVTKALSVVVAVIGIALAPMTGGLSLLATAYLCVDLALDLGEHFSGTKMSIQSGLQIVCAKVIELVAKHLGTSEQRQLAASVLAAILNLVIALVVTTISAGAAGPKLFQGIKNLFNMGQKGVTAMHKVNAGVQYVANAATGGASFASGYFAYDTANAEYKLASTEIERAGLEKMTTELDQMWAQSNEYLKRITKELQSNTSLIADAISNNIENDRKIMTTLFHSSRTAA
jgi:tetratricopeptide (TPR) repeat protein